MNVESQIVLDEFTLRHYQVPIRRALLQEGKRRIIAILPRRAGKDLACWNILIREALKKPAIYWMIYPTYSMGRKILWDGLTNEGKSFLSYIPKSEIKSIHQQEMKIRLVNESVIQIQGSDSPDRLVGANCYGAVFSEYALQDPIVYQQIVRPMLTANNGFAIFISCVSPETLVIGEKGLQRIKNVSSSRSEYSDLNKPIYGLKGFHNAEQFYFGGKQKTLKITLQSGYQIECTPIHPLWNGNNWIKAQDLKIEDLLPIQYGQNIWGNGLEYDDFYYKQHGHLKNLNFEFDSDDLFYLLGLIHADGCYDINKVCVTKKKDRQIIDFLHRMGFKTRKDGIHHELNSKELCAFLEYLGFKHGARNKTFPDKLFECTKEQIKSFLQGLFDGDGTSNSCPSKFGYVKLTSTNREFLGDLQIILLNFGIVSSINSEFKKPTKRVKVSSIIFNLSIQGYFAHLFYNNIGFRLERKQNNKKYIPEKVKFGSGNCVPIDLKQLAHYKFPKNIFSNPSSIQRRKLELWNKKRPHPYFDEVLSHNFYFSPIKEIIESENEVFDFVIPETHSFFSNGFISHNTPRGKANHLWELWNIAQSNPEHWYAYLMTVEQTGHIPIAEIKRLIDSGEMEESLAKQEFYCDFSRGVEGSFYGAYLDKARLNGRIGHVPHEPGLLVHCSMDIGVNDATTLLWYQIAGQTVRVINCYSNHSVGLDHYVDILHRERDKWNYKMGRYFAPFDIKVREFGAGALTRYEQARQMGINYNVLEQIGLQEGINNVWMNFHKIYIDETQCRSLIDALENYRREWDEQRKRHNPIPLKTWACHYADAFRYMVQSLPLCNMQTTKPIDLEKRFQEARYGSDMSHNMFKMPRA